MEPGNRLQEELDAFATELGHSLSVDAPDGRLLAYSAQDTAADPARVAAILSRHVSPEVLDWENRHGIAEATGPISVPANPDLGMAGRLCVPIRGTAGHIGYLWVLEAREALDESAIARAAAFAEWLGRAEDDPATDVTGMVRRLLGDRPKPEALDRLAAAVPALPGTNVRVCVALPVDRQRAALTTMTSAEFHRLTGTVPAGMRTSPGYVGSFVGASAVVLLTFDMGAAECAEALSELGSRSESGALTVGLSEAVRYEPAALANACDHAFAAAELAALDPVLPNPVGWEQLGPYRAFAEPGGGGLLDRLDATGARASMLLATLETYLDLGGNARRTAERLHLHRTSLYYRLERIAEILDANLDDGLTRLELHIALKRRRYDRRTHTSSSVAWW